jgi:protein SCO1/2
MTRSAAHPVRRKVLLALLMGAWATGMRPGAVRANAALRYSEGVTVKVVKLDAVPAVPVMSMSGQAVRLDRELDTNTPVLLNFIFTTCSTTCSMQTAVLAELQRQLAQRGQALHLVSITIDPDNDTPEQLRKFSKSFEVRPGWQFLTGRFDDLLRVQRHFDVYRGSKAAHPPVVMLRGSSRAPWMRMEGIASTADLALALQSLPAT